MRLLIFIVMVVFTGTSAIAGDIPEYDVQSHCVKTSKMMGNSEFMLKSCYQQEQSSYNDLKPKWAAIPPKIQGHCMKTAKLMGKSYFMLKSCIDQEVTSRAENKSFKFKF